LTKASPAGHQKLPTRTIALLEILLAFRSEKVSQINLKSIITQDFP